MTWFLAANVFLSLLGPGQQQAALEDPVWSRVKGSVARFDSLGQQAGMAVLVDARGYFLAHRSQVVVQPLVGRMEGSELVLLNLVATDDQTQLALLKAQNWKTGSHPAVKVAAMGSPGSPLIAATPSGPVKGELVASQLIGQMKSTLRYIPLSEVRLEANVSPVAGAIVFDAQGQLVGLLGATLAGSVTRQGAATAAPKLSLTEKAGVQTSAKPDGLGQGMNTMKQYGPQGMTVAYTLGSSVLSRVVTGLLRPDHHVEHPSIGIFFKAAKEPGAVVEELVSGSPAAQAGLAIGDTIVGFGERTVKSPIDLAMALFECSVGDQVEIRIRRDGEERTVTVTVGDQPGL